MAATAQIFDASLQEVVEHTLEVDANGEIVATSTKSGRSIKFPAGLTRKQFDKAVADHQKNAEGHEVISAEELEAQEKATEASNSLLAELGGEKGSDEE